MVVGRDDPGWAGATTFPYPRDGRIGTLWLRVFERLPRHRVALRERLIGLDAEQRIAYFSSGMKVRYRYLISSSPLPELLGLMPAASALHREKTPLRHSSTHSIGFGVRGTLPKILEDKYWIYVPEPDAPYFRVTVMSNFSRKNAPTDEPFWSIACETSARPGENLDPSDLVAWAERSLRASFLPPGQPIVSHWYRRLNYGYPLPCLRRDRFLQEMQPALRRSGILARGRFGSWKYETSNQDNAFMQGVEAVDSVLFGTEEMSYFHPDEVSKGSVKRRLSDWEPREPWLQAPPRSVA